MTESARRPPDDIVGVSLSGLRSVVGQRIVRVAYKSSADLFPDAGIHEVDQAVVISTDSATMVLEWRIRNYDEFLSVVEPPDKAVTTALGALDVSGLPPWSALVGSAIAGFGVATQASEAGDTLLWALRMDFEIGASVVVALGELQGATPNYQPDGLLVISDPETAQTYQVLGAPESAWGRVLHL